ncbi:MAG: hypothetical protein NTW38_05575 [Candidatus Aminicenantes bacterium]|nr:hypothetical protein [Candidatus Aminicenantes bacterium]
MTVFIIVALLSLAGLLFYRTAVRYLASAPAAESGENPSRFKPGAYLRWLGIRTKTYASPSFFRKSWDVWNGWAEAHYPGWTKWIFLGGAAAFLYLAVSGLFFSIFIRRGLFGLPLLAHVAAGGLFAIGLAAVLMFRAGAHRFDRQKSAVFEAIACPIFKNLSKEFVRKIIFWIFASLGFVQVTTALCSMLPVFTFNTQVALLMIHRWSALGLALAAIVFFDIILPERTKTPQV